MNVGCTEKTISKANKKKIISPLKKKRLYGEDCCGSGVVWGGNAVMTATMYVFAKASYFQLIFYDSLDRLSALP